MLDRGLLLSAGAVLVAVWMFGRTRRSDEPALSDLAFWPALIGLVVGRLVALGLDDPAGLRSMRNLLLLRGGVELWPGVAAGTLAALVVLRRRHRSLADAASLLVPSAVAAWAAYDLACLVRDGCPGPASPLGLRPSGLHTTQLPVGVVAGLLGLAAAVTLRRHPTKHSTSWLVLGALLIVSTLRSIESIWLPSFSTRLTRQWATSIAVATGSCIAAAVIALQRRATRRGSGANEQPLPSHAAPELATPPPLPTSDVIATIRRHGVVDTGSVGSPER